MVAFENHAKRRKMNKFIETVRVSLENQPPHGLRSPSRLAVFGSSAVRGHRFSINSASNATKSAVTLTVSEREVQPAQGRELPVYSSSDSSFDLSSLHSSEMSGARAHIPGTTPDQQTQQLLPAPGQGGPSKLQRTDLSNSSSMSSFYSSEMDDRGCDVREMVHLSKSVISNIGNNHNAARAKENCTSSSDSSSDNSSVELSDASSDGVET